MPEKGLVYSLPKPVNERTFGILKIYAVIAVARFALSVCECNSLGLITFIKKIILINDLENSNGFISIAFCDMYHKKFIEFSSKN
tara:strand:+ start:521 stop:775 length:255 start_codon:yes stop_codon:yes gene_type:complete